MAWAMETLALDLANEAVEGYLNSPTRRTMADRAAQDAQKAARAEYRKAAGRAGRDEGPVRPGIRQPERAV